MEFVNKLQRLQRNKTSVRKTLLAYGDKDWSNHATPLERLSEEEIATLIFNWEPTVLGTNETIKVRWKADQKVYEAWFKKTKNIIQVRQIREKKRCTEHMYRWKPGETFNDIKALDDLRQRMAMTDVLKKPN